MIKRIQRKRKKAPPNTRFCGRRTKYGNPYKVTKIAPGKYVLLNTQNNKRGATIHKGPAAKQMAVKKAVQMFVFFFHRKYQTEEELKEFLAPLRKYDYLSCWCREDAKHCHVDYLISLINKFWPEQTQTIQELK